MAEFILALSLVMPDGTPVNLELPAAVSCRATYHEARRLFVWAGINIQSAQCWRRA